MRTPEQRLDGLPVSGAGSQTWIRPSSAPLWRRHLDEEVARRCYALLAQVRAARPVWGNSIGPRDTSPLPAGAEAPARRPRDLCAPAWASAPSRAAGLSAREWDVLALIITGRSNRVIAGRLAIRPNLVHKHIRTILDKLGARSRSQAIAVVLGREELEGDPEAG